MNREVEDALRREVANWPGVSVRKEARGRHNALVLTLGERERFHIFTSTKSNARASKNAVSDIRKTLRILGATRTK